ncbi:oxidoreductase [Streptomyces sp. Act143]|uniref:SDR family NAD(P)-dependent oxidoreductase n=1 Tax=Streptomyces sp. Act143 TaxID=2200760 RepID=UPI000D68404A|nr:SDR family NAD(P)-dependent oxidoreductase [Streptomyces sp. Act143]PWI19383.1 oxidoreductase [Streptomyces sp. Act143]
MAEKALYGAVALVTGASSGIGAATARRLAQDGASVALLARRRERLLQVADDIVGIGGEAHVIKADITEPGGASAAVQDTLDRFGRLDILVNNAGVMLLGTALHTRIEEWDRMVALNVAGLLHMTHAAVPYLIDAAATSPREVADIVNIGSTAARTARPGNSVYSLTKAGLSSFTESLRQELLTEQVRVSLVEPGTVATELMDQLSEAAGDVACWQMDGTEPLRAHDVADAIGYIVTRERRVAVNELLLRSGAHNW